MQAAFAPQLLGGVAPGAEKSLAAGASVGFVRASSATTMAAINPPIVLKLICIGSLNSARAIEAQLASEAQAMTTWLTPNAHHSNERKSSSSVTDNIPPKI